MGFIGMDKLVKDKQGITVMGVAISLFLSVALIFSGAQLYRIQSASAEIQEVSDVSALAAENEVAGFLVIANTSDAVCLTLTLLASTLYGLGLVAACIPPTAALSARLIDWGSKLVDQRKRFYQLACKGLNKAQQLLPFLATVNALRTAAANNDGALPSRYFAGALLVPLEYKTLGADNADGLEEACNAITNSADDIRSKSEEAEAAAKAADEAKQRGFEQDCGLDPNYCMRERAASLAQLEEAENPSFTSSDAWSFSVALQRAQSYYKKRQEIWRIEGRSTEAKADSVLRKRFYDFAVTELQDAYVEDGPQGFKAYLPHFFRNTNELRQTDLYTEQIYPVTQTDSNSTMHAWPGCKRSQNAVRSGSIKELDTNARQFQTCDLCKFVPSSLGSVAAASTSIENGFENHYERMRQACLDYEAARKEADPLTGAVKGKVQALLDALKEVLKNAGKYRIHAEPPGRAGSISLVVNTASNRADTGFESSFVQGEGHIGMRAAVAAASLVEDQSEPAGALVSETLAGLSQQFGIGGVGAAASVVTNTWMSLLKAYEDGQHALVEGIRKGLNGFSHATSSGLGNWAADALLKAISAVGLEPAKTACMKPAIVNTNHVASKDSSSVPSKFLKIKQLVLSGSSSSTSGIDALAAGIVGAIDKKTNGKLLTIAEIQLPFAESGVLQWALPVDEGKDALSIGDAAQQVVKKAQEWVEGVRIWQ